MTQTTGFGKPKFNSGGFAKSFRLKQGPNVYRLLPPMNELAEDGTWCVYHGTHFGYKGVNAKDPSKPQLRTFRCVEQKDLRTKVITQDCPECDLIAQYEQDKENLENQLKAEKKPEDEIKELTAHLTGWLKEHNCDRKWHIHAKNKQGEFGTLQISHKTKKRLDAEIARLMTEEGIDALDIGQGVWFVFTRSGTGIATDDIVTVEEEMVKDPTSGRVSKTTKLAPLTEEECTKALKECPNLYNVVRVITYQQIKLLTTCSGEPDDVDEILSMGQKREGSPASRPAAPKPESKPEPKPETKAEPQAPQAEATPSSEPSAEDDEEAALQAQLMALRAQKAQKLAAQAAPKTEPKLEAAPAAKAEPAASVPAKPAQAPAAGLPLNREAFMAKFQNKGGQGQQ